MGGRVCFAYLSAAAALVAAGATAHAAPIIHWKLDEAAGNTAADSAAAGGAQNGTSGNAAPQWQPTGGIIGGALRMSATAQADVDENVTHTAAADIVPDYPFTLSSWVNTASSVAYRETFVYLGDQTQAEMIYNVAFQLDDPEFAVAQLPQHGGMREEDALWGLFTVNEDVKPKQLLERFHEIWASIVPPPKWNAAARPAP